MSVQTQLESGPVGLSTRLLSWLKGFFGGIFWQHILFPFITSRLVLMLIAWFGNYFTADAGYARYIQKGYFLSSFFPIDIWSRWDAEWYLSIAKSGYVPSANLTTTYSNLAFFPLFPDLVRLVTLPFHIKASSTSIYLAVGLLISNLCFLAAAYLLYKMVVQILHDETIAQRTVLLLIAFPAGFFFSTFYPESLFLFLAVALFYAGLRKRWVLAALCGALAAITRPQGLLLALPLAWMYLEARGWKLRAIRPDAVSFLLFPAFLAGHWVELYAVTGDWLALFHAQAAWGRFGALFLGNLIQQLSSAYLYPFRVDLGLYLVFIGATIYALFKMPSKAWGIGALALLTMPLLSGLWFSLSRYLVTIFPVFIVLGWVTRRRELYILLLAFFITLQALYFFGWTGYYFIA
jgi:hypothetical protein